MEYTIDAKDKKLGRIASMAAHRLMGKATTEYKRNAVAPVKVRVLNVSRLSIDPKKLEQHSYARYSGYPGGLRYETLGHVIEKRGYAEMFRDVVYGMLPPNRLRSRTIKNLIITE